MARRPGLWSPKSLVLSYIPLLHLSTGEGEIMELWEGRGDRTTRKNSRYHAFNPLGHLSLLHLFEVTRSPWTFFFF